MARRTWSSIAGAMPPEIKVKGTVLSGLIRAADAHVPGETRDGLLRTVNGELHNIIETKSIGPTVWYPVAWHREILGYLVGELGAERLGDVVRRSTRDNVGTVHRALMRMFSPATLMGRTALIFGAFFGGRCETKERGPGITDISWSGCHGFDKNCWVAQRTTVEELVAMSGARQIHSKLLAGGRDYDAEMSVEITWQVTA